MSHVRFTREGEIGILALQRGKVNAINEEVVKELRTRLDELRADKAISALVLTGSGKFFSFGFDVPEFYDLEVQDVTRFLTSFTDMYTDLYIYPKPVVAALNGHTIAAGCMVALACDRRLMVDRAGKISLNEITFGASVFAGSVEMLRACVGQRQAEKVLYTGMMYTPEQALAFGLVDRLTSAEELLPRAVEEAQYLGAKDRQAFTSIKKLVRGPVAESMRQREADSIQEFVKIWYSETTREQLKEIKIRD